MQTSEVCDNFISETDLEKLKFAAKSQYSKSLESRNFLLQVLEQKRFPVFWQNFQIPRVFRFLRGPCFPYAVVTPFGECIGLTALSAKLEYLQNYLSIF